MSSTLQRLIGLAAYALAATTARAANYYVDPAGDDLAAGTSPQTAWKTFAKVNSARFAPGDSVLLKRGGLWRETLMPSSRGEKGRPVTYGAYGEGARPIILGSVDKSGAANWTAGGDKLWYCTGVSWKPNPFKMTQGMIFHDGVGGRDLHTKDQLKDDWDWCFDPSSGRAYIHLDHNPGSHHIEVEQRNGVGFASVPYITIRDLEIAYATFGVGIWEAEGWTIENCAIHDVVTDAVHANGAKKSPRAGTVRNCDIRDYGWKGYMYLRFNYDEWSKNEAFMGYGLHVFQSDDWQVVGNRIQLVNMLGAADLGAVAFDEGGHASLVADNYIQGNGRIRGPGAAIGLWHPKGSTPVVIRNNYIESFACGISINDFKATRFTQPVTIESNLLINLCNHDPLDVEAIRVWPENDAPITVRNNVVLGTGKGKNPHAGIRLRDAKGEVYNNTVTGADNGFGFERNAVVIARNNISTSNRALAVWLDNTSKLTESNNDWNGQVQGFKPAPTDLNADPGLIHPLHGEGRLAPDSPCRGRGVDVGLPFKGSAPDMGAGELKVPASQPAATHPSGLKAG